MSNEKTTLCAEDIKIGVAQVTDVGVFLYLKADPRDIMDKLDEKFGPLGWQEVHETKVERENGMDILVCRCTLSVWNNERNAWISRDGFSSSMDFSGVHRMKAEASDALKLAAIQFGIGRELYSFDNIFAYAKSDKGETLINIFKDDQGKCWTNDEFAVTQIINDETTGKIKALAIKDVTTDRMIFAEDRRTPSKQKKNNSLTPVPKNKKYISLAEAKAMDHDCTGNVAGKKLGQLTADELFYVYGRTGKRDIKIACIAIAQTDASIGAIFNAGGIPITA